MADYILSKLEIQTQVRWGNVQEINQDKDILIKNGKSIVMTSRLVHQMFWERIEAVIYKCNIKGLLKGNDPEVL